MKNYDNVPSRIKKLSISIPEEDALYSKDTNGAFQIITFKQFYNHIKEFGAGLLSLGAKKGDHIGLISDNRKEWLIADMAIMGIGGADVPRGSDSTADEIGFILKHADCPMAVLENKDQVDKVLAKKDDLPELKKIIVIDFEGVDKSGDFEIVSFDDVVASGKKELEKSPEIFDSALEGVTPEDLATIIYTSGTTGEPKGVMLTHKNFLFQMDRTKSHIALGPEDIMLSVLPIWHSFERAVEYLFINQGCAIAYSKPVGQILIEDMGKVKPTWLISVPRIWESLRNGIYKKLKKGSPVKRGLFNFFVSVSGVFAKCKNLVLGRNPRFDKRIGALDVLLGIIPLILLAPLRGLGELLVFKTIKEKLGGRYVAGISGGGALPGYVDTFFQAVGIKILEGYGMTETAPVLTVRKQFKPITNTVGPFLNDIQHKVLDNNDLKTELPPGRKGVLFVKSDQIMKGYYKRDDETKKVITPDGWLNTGDLVKMTHRGELKIIGRVKDTIVLMGGENIEPDPIESKLCQSDYIEQVMVCGQDQKYLGALIVPVFDEIIQYAKSEGLGDKDLPEILKEEKIKDLINKEIQHLINPQNGFKAFERIFKFSLLGEVFEVGKELTRSLKIKRRVVYKKYKNEVNALFE